MQQQQQQQQQYSRQNELAAKANKNQQSSGMLLGMETKDEGPSLLFHVEAPENLPDRVDPSNRARTSWTSLLDPTGTIHTHFNQTKPNQKLGSYVLLSEPCLWRCDYSPRVCTSGHKQSHCRNGSCCGIHPRNWIISATARRLCVYSTHSLKNSYINI